MTHWAASPRHVEHGGITVFARECFWPPGRPMDSKLRFATPANSRPQTDTQGHLLLRLAVRGRIHIVPFAFQGTGIGDPAPTRPWWMRTGAVTTPASMAGCSRPRSTAAWCCDDHGEDGHAAGGRRGLCGHVDTRPGAVAHASMAGSPAPSIKRRWMAGAKYLSRSTPTRADQRHLTNLYSIWCCCLLSDSGVRDRPQHRLSIFNFLNLNRLITAATVPAPGAALAGSHVSWPPRGAVVRHLAFRDSCGVYGAGHADHRARIRRPHRPRSSSTGLHSGQGSFRRDIRPMDPTG